MNNNLPQYKNPPPPPERTTTNETSGEMREGNWRPITKTTDDGEPRGNSATNTLCELLAILGVLSGIGYVLMSIFK